MVFKFDAKVVLRDMQNDFPRISRTLVKSADIGASYVPGSENSVKVESYYDDEDVLRATVTYKYEDDDAPTTWTDCVTSIIEI